MKKSQKACSIEPALLAPLILITSVSRYKCQCGHISEIPLASAQKLLSAMETLGCLPEISIIDDNDFKKYYFEISYCPKCRKINPEKEVKIELKLLKRS